MEKVNNSVQKCFKREEKKLFTSLESVLFVKNCVHGLENAAEAALNNRNVLMLVIFFLIFLIPHECDTNKSRAFDFLIYLGRGLVTRWLKLESKLATVFSSIL